MATQTRPVEQAKAPALPEPIRHWQFTVTDYYRMAEVGILSEDDRVELIEGQIIQMSPIGSPHAGIINRLVALLGPLVSGKAMLGIQNPVHLSDRSEPQPDLALLKPREDYYQKAHPTPADILILIEVSDSTLAYDQQVKIPLYASAMIPEVWLFDVGNKLIVQHSKPSATGYQLIQQLPKGKTITSVMLPDLTLNVDEFFGQ